MISIAYIGEAFEEYCSELKEIIKNDSVIRIETSKSYTGETVHYVELVRYNFSKDAAEKFFDLNNRYATKFRNILDNNHSIITANSFTANYYPEEDYSEVESWIVFKFYGNNKIIERD